ncbi:MAG: hypothetical protein WEE64_12240 [Dehalococcoidia bacterium]
MMNGTLRLRFTVLTLLLGLALAFALIGSSHDARRAEAALSAPDLAMTIDHDGGGDDCDTRSSTASIGTTCTVTVGNMFTLKGNIDKVAGLPGTGGYIVFQFQFLYTNPGLTRNNRTGSMEVGPDAGAGVPTFWKNMNAGSDIPCAPNSEVDGAGSYYVDCWGPGTKSSYTGTLVEVDFTCATLGTRTITMQDAGTYVHNQSHGNTPPDVDGDEVLTIECVTGAAVGGVAGPPDVARSPLQASRDQSGPAGWLTAMLAAAAAGGIAFGGAFWYARGRRSS